MRYSPESLTAFVEAAAQGSFSAAARKLNKSQSTISIAISNFETDIGCQLFDRSGRQPVLNDAGHLVLDQVRAILDEGDRLDALATRLADNVEPRLSVVLSDVYYPLFKSDILPQFEARFPDTEFQCGPAEGADVISLLQSGHAHVGILAAHQSYPPDIAVSRLGVQAEFGLFVSDKHPLSKMPKLSLNDLQGHRQLSMKTYAPDISHRKGRIWSAPDYLTLLEFAVRGFGWAELPRPLVHIFGHGRLVELPARGYPRRIDIDVVWTRKTPLGPAGQWFVDQLLGLG